VSRQGHEIAVFGATGYAGQVLVRLLKAHPTLSPRAISARDPASWTPADRAAVGTASAVALALPAEASKTWAPVLREHTKAPVLDLSDAFRTSPGVPYGIFELWPEPIASAHLVANPGCYPTATLLALAPLLRRGLVAQDTIAVVGKSGASGAGKKVAEHLHFCELAGNSFPYNVGRHRHIREIEHHLGAPVCLVTELLPIVRGLSVTAFVRPTCDPAALHRALCEAYEAHPYVHVLDAPDARLGLRHVVGTHDARIAVGPVTASGLVPVFCSIDNLMRGAASAALVALNRLHGLDPHAGLAAPVPPGPALPGMKAAWT